MNEVLKQVEAIISPVYMVGGSVRDSLLGHTPKDYDFATPLSPEEIESRIKKAGRRVYSVGKRFGTLGFKVKTENGYEYVEVTTFRAEKYKEGSRKPDVEFVRDLSADLSRRDFTMNAIAVRGSRLIDQHGGQEDIKNKVLRSVGLASHRFKEDPLRMLRAGRFISQLGFEPDEEIIKAVKNMNHKILEVSRERWMQEMDKLLVGDWVMLGLNFLMETRLINFMFPELSVQYKYDQMNPHHDFELWEHTIRVVNATPKDLTLRWSALLHDIAKPFTRTKKKDKDHCNYIKHDLIGAEIVLKYASYLKWSNDRKEAVYKIIRGHMSKDSILSQYEEKSKEIL
jgi:tRNA nucleotidyltransferase (CCA-adding enzyme)